MQSLSPPSMQLAGNALVPRWTEQLGEGVAKLECEICNDPHLPTCWSITLDSARLQQPGQVEAVLAAALPPAAVVTSLSLVRCLLSSAALAGCSRLTSVTDMLLLACAAPAASIATAVLGDLLQCTPRLTSLGGVDMDLSAGLPPMPASLQAVTMEFCSLSEIPNGSLAGACAAATAFEASACC